MQSATLSAAFCVWLMPMGVATAGAPVVPSLYTAAPAQREVPDDDSSDNNAATRHAKRFACAFEAKRRKLVGEEKKVFIQNCTADQSKPG